MPMKVFAISDLHLSKVIPKPMDLFGPRWKDHWERVQANWQCIGQEDLVLIAGDISWAMYLEDALPDLLDIGRLPGKKVMIRGNHDYWWNSVKKVREVLPEGMFALQNDAVNLGGLTVCGTRGWSCPGSVGFGPEDKKLYQREVIRMELSLKAAEKIRTGPLAVMIHYPPFNERQEPSGFVELFSRYGVDKVIYGHLHCRSCQCAFEGVLDGVEYILTSCDHLELQPTPIDF